MELMGGEDIINVYSIPVSTFSNTDENTIISTLSDIFDGMIDDLVHCKKTFTVKDWDGVNFFIVDGNYKSLEVFKTKNEMNLYSSYGEGLLDLYNEIISNN